MSGSDTIAGLGARDDFVAPVPNLDPSHLGPEERAVLERVGRRARIADVLRGSGLGEAKTIATLLSLRAKGAIVPARGQASGAAAVHADAAMAEQVDLDPERKREILELERLLERGSHFDLLGVPPGAPAEECKEAYYDMSRKFHPDRYYGKSLGSFRVRMETIFKRLSEAERVLTDSTRRAGYLAAHPELAASKIDRPRSETDLHRDAERRARFAKHPYLARAGRVNEVLSRGKQHLEKGEFGLALADFQLVLQMDPGNKDALALTANTRKKYEANRIQQELDAARAHEQAGDYSLACLAYQKAAAAEVGYAKAAYKAAFLMHKLGMDGNQARLLAQRAVEAEPRNAEYRVFLGKLLADLGQKALASKQFEEVLKVDPENAEAKKRLKKFPWPF